MNIGYEHEGGKTGTYFYLGLQIKPI